jgi:hypothetical protein
VAVSVYKDLGILKREAELEQKITDACTRLSMAVTQDQAHTEFEQIRVLIAQRSPQQIERLERARGLRK